MRCEHCEAEFSPKNVRGGFCSAKCRKTAWRRHRDDRETRMREQVKGFVKATGLTTEDLGW